MTSNVLEKFLEQDAFKLPIILPISACLTENVTLKEALAKRQKAEAVLQEDLYVIVDADDEQIEKGRVAKFIWDLWTSVNLDNDGLNYSKMVHNTIPTKLSVAAVDLLTFFLYNGQFPREEVNFPALLDLHRQVSSLNLDKQFQDAVASALSAATSIDNIRKAWKKGASLSMMDSALFHQTVAYIICYPEKIFTGNEAWLDMPRELLEKLVPDSLANMMEKLKEYGATMEKRKILYCAEQVYIQINHFELLFFLVEWGKRYYTRVMNPQRNIIDTASVSDLRMALGSIIKMLDPTTFDVSKFNGDPAVEDAESFVNILNAYILLKNIFKDSGDQGLFLPVPGEDKQGRSSKRKRLMVEVVDQNPTQNNMLAIKGSNQTTRTEERISKLSETLRLTDKNLNAHYSAVILQFHSYMIRLRKSVFNQAYNQIGGTSIVFDLGGVTEKSAVNFFKSFYQSNDELRKVVTVDLEFCFLALLFQVDFLLETVFLFTKGNRTCMESRVMHFVSAYRLYHNSTRDERQIMLKEMNKTLQSDALNVVRTISFKFFFDEEMIQKLLGDYDAGGPGFYYNVINELESMSKIQMWLRKESTAVHADRIKKWKSSGVIRLNKVTKDELKDLASCGFLDMNDAIEYSYAIGTSNK